MKKHTLRHGGIRYSDASAPNSTLVRHAFLPSISIVPMLQHDGTSCTVLVKKGDHVSEGMLIGRAVDADSAHIHAPVPGTVLDIFQWTAPDGRQSDALVIRLEGAFDKLGRKAPAHSLEQFSADLIRRIMTEKGLVCMESGGMPLAQVTKDVLNYKGEHTILLSCLDDDPWMVSDVAVIKERLDAVCKGLLLFLKACRVEKACIACSDKDLASHIIEHTISIGLELGVLLLDTIYPISNTVELKNAFARWAQHTQAPIQTCSIIGPSTLAALYDAVVHDKPLMERYIAIGGDSVKEPSVLKARIGSRIGDLLQECGGFSGNPVRIVCGSPLTGWSVSNLDVPVTKTCSAIVVLSSEQVDSVKQWDCISCGECRLVCPVGLDPERLYKLLSCGEKEQAILEGAATCHGCACCAAVCPSRIPLRSGIFYQKAYSNKIEGTRK